MYEREDRVGGLLMYGIPNMKLDKDTVKRRIDLLAEEGIEFVTGANIGVDVDVNDVRASCDALVLTVGSTKPRDLPVPGREVRAVEGVDCRWNGWGRVPFMSYLAFNYTSKYWILADPRQLSHESLSTASRLSCLNNCC